MNYVCDALVIASMFMLLMYYSKYGKVDGYLSRIEDELADAGYYLSDRPEREIQPLTAAVLADLDRYGYTVERDLELSEMPFDARAMKKKEFFYVVETEALTRGDILAYSDAAFTDLTVQKMKRHNYLTYLRMQHCRKALEEGVSVLNACTESGFPDYSSFLKTFRRLYGITPAEYRAQNRTVVR